jgi:diketogulonate reductase-like aldo/keto reductase
VVGALSPSLWLWPWLWLPACVPPVSAAQHPGKSTAQIALRWLVQGGHPFTTATGRADYIKEDLAIFDFELSAAEMGQLDAISLPRPADCNPNAP